VKAQLELSDSRYTKILDPLWTKSENSLHIEGQQLCSHVSKLPCFLSQRGGHIPTVITNSVDYTYDWEDLIPDGLRDAAQEPMPSAPPKRPSMPPPLPTPKPRSTVPANQAR
jgi:hypothetical protein